MIVVLIGWLLMLVVDIWCVIGVWCVVGCYLVDGGLWLWGLLVWILMGFGVL